MKFCKDCIHSFVSDGMLTCTFKSEKRLSIVYGYHYWNMLNNCLTERVKDCGEKAKNYSRKWWKFWRPK